MEPNSDTPQARYERGQQSYNYLKELLLDWAHNLPEKLYVISQGPGGEGLALGGRLMVMPLRNKKDMSWEIQADQVCGGLPKEGLQTIANVLMQMT
jgi:hypothetical protein